MQEHYTVELFGSELAPGGSESVIIPLVIMEGHFTAQISVSGGGQATLSAEVSNDSQIWAPCRDEIIATDVSSGIPVVASFTPQICRYIRLTVSESGGVSSATPDVVFVMG